MHMVVVVGIVVGRQVLVEKPAHAQAAREAVGDRRIFGGGDADAFVEVVLDFVVRAEAGEAVEIDG